MKHKKFDFQIDELKLLIELVLSRNRSSLSIDDVANLERCIICLEELKEETSESGRKDIVIAILLKVMHNFCKPEVWEYIKTILESLEDLN